MKKYILGLISIIGLGIINFSSAGSYTLSGTVNYSVSSTTSTTPKANDIFKFNFPFRLWTGSINSDTLLFNVTDFNVSCTISNYSGSISCLKNNSGAYVNVYYHNQTAAQTQTLPYIQVSNDNVPFGNGTYDMVYSKSDSYLPYNFHFFMYTCGPYDSTTISFDYSCVVSGSSVLSLSDLQCSNNGNCDYSDYTLTSDITKSYCTNRYSDLIDESDITSGYCETEFGLIDPENCPASSGTGDVQWSAFFVNSHQIQGASNIYLYLPDFLNWDYTYLNSGSSLEIEVENQGDEDYINGLISVETFHPSSEDFTQSFTGILTLLMPYIIITLFILFIWRLVKRIFK